MTKYAFTIALCGLLGACSGSGVSTTARDDIAPDTVGDGGDGGTGGDDGGDGSPADDGDGSPDDGGDDTPADDGGDDAPADDGDDAADDSGDDSSADGDTGAGDDGGEPATFEGVWLSEGSDIAPLLVDLTNAVTITATFTADTFTVFTIDSDGNEVNQSGIYLAEASGVGDIFTITLEQTVPQPITVEGIYELDNSVSPAILRYEVVQTSPTVGAQKPTPELGFGGTGLGEDLTQIFVRQ
ncbi:MAG: hypothetical protein AAF721_13000 [Myxococcota bacterium]